MPTLTVTAMTFAIFLPLLFIPLVLLLSSRLERLTGYLAMLAPLGSAGLIFWLANQVGPAPQRVLTLPWVPSLGLNFSLLFNGLSLFFGMVICCVGVLVCWYGAEYLGSKYRFHGRFYISLLLFITAMLGTVFSDNILLMYIFWECTGVASFMLIGFSHDDEKSRTGARQALIVTVGTGLLMLAGIAMLRLSTGTFSFSAIYQAGLPQGLSSSWTSWMLVLLLMGAFGKSAQFPFHFWLPGAMAAPTPVSAYLHSATMVKLGVFLTARLFPIFAELPLWFWLVSTVAFVTMVLGAFLALRSNDLKSILAFSTVSQLGFLIGVYGIGSRTGILYDYLHILSHVFYKGSLFMVAGIVDKVAGTRDVRKLGGLIKHIPVIAVVAAVGVAAMAGIPLTTGFVSKEILLADLTTAGSKQAGVWLYVAMVVISAIMTVAFAARIFFSVFMGKEPSSLKIKKPGILIQVPPVILGAGAFIFGVMPAGLEGLLNWLRVPGMHGEIGHLTLWHGFNIPLALSITVFILGALFYLWSEKTQWGWTVIPRWLRYDEAFEAGLDWLGRFAKNLTNALQADWPPMYLRVVIAFLLIISSLTVFFTPHNVFEGLRDLDWTFDIARILVGLGIIISLIGITIMPLWTSQLVCLSGAGFLLTFYFVLYRAPDLAMTQILVESASVVMILLLLSRFPLSHVEASISARQRIGRFMRFVLAAGTGLAMFLLVLISELYRHPDPAGFEIAKAAKPLADGENVVNVILVDFRGFDTLGEITVLLTATLGALGLMMRYVLRHEGKGREPLPPGFLLSREREKE